MRHPGSWWLQFFADFGPLFGTVSREETRAQIRFLTRKLDLRPGRRFLDCPCGIGRIALPLARRGVRVTGVDITKAFLTEAEAKARRGGLKLRLIHGDMRRIDFENSFHAAGNMWTSFGYFERRSDDRLVVRRMFRALKPGGRFALHVINRDWIMAQFQPQSWYESGKLKALEHREFDYASSIVHSDWHFLSPEGEVKHESAIRVYAYHELIALFESAGFTDIEGFGSERGDPISRDHRMMYVIGTKPRAGTTRRTKVATRAG